MNVYDLERRGNHIGTVLLLRASNTPPDDTAAPCMTQRSNCSLLEAPEVRGEARPPEIGEHATRVANFHMDSLEIWKAPSNHRTRRRVPAPTCWPRIDSAKGS